jgi:hypothetical protein
MGNLLLTNSNPQPVLYAKGADKFSPEEQEED